MRFARPQLVALAAVLSLLAAPGALAAPASSAAHPTKGAVYVGTIKSTPFTMRLNIGVTADGKKLRFTYECGNGSGTYVKKNIPIDQTGQFKYTAANGTWKMAGRFLSATKAQVSLNSVVCGGSKGSTNVTVKAGGKPAAPAGPAVQPKKGGVYVGTIKSTPFTMRLNIGVTADGKKLRFTYECGNGSGTYVKKNLPIDQTGRFKYTAPNGTWKMAGRFLSATKAHVSLNSVVCGGSKGSTKVSLK